jgi:hypothetical protein
LAGHGEECHYHGGLYDGRMMGGPTVGRSQEAPQPLYTSTPLEMGGMGSRDVDQGESNYEVQDMQVEESGRGYVDIE